MRVSVVAADGISPDVAEFWSRLRANDAPWMGVVGTLEWFRMMGATPGNRPMMAVVRGEDGRVHAALPLLFQAGSLLCRCRRPVALARVCGGDVIEDGQSAESLSALWNGILEREPQVQAIILDHVAESRMTKVLASCMRSRFFAHYLSDVMPHYRLILPPTIEAFRGLRSAESFKKIEGRERAMAREYGATRVVEIRTPADWQPHEDAVLAMMNQTWQSRRLGQTFHWAGLVPVAAHGWLRSFLLCAGDRPVAFVEGYQGAGVFTYERIGFDAIFGKYSPSTILLYRVIEALYRRDLPACMDFGEGEAAYKRQLANHVTQSRSVVLIRREWRWYLLALFVRLRRGAKSVGRAAVDGLGWKGMILKRLKGRGGA